MSSDEEYEGSCGAFGCEEEFGTRWGEGPAEAEVEYGDGAGVGETVVESPAELAGV